MPYDDPEPDDPNLLVGVGLPAGPGTTREMAAAFACEFAQLGLGRQQLLALFRNSFYAGAHAAWRELGEGEVTRLVDEALDAYGRQRVVVRDAPPQPPSASR